MKRILIYYKIENVKTSIFINNLIYVYKKIEKYLTCEPIKT